MDLLIQGSILVALGGIGYQMMKIRQELQIQTILLSTLLIEETDVEETETEETEMDESELEDEVGEINVGLPEEVQEDHDSIRYTLDDEGSCSIRSPCIPEGDTGCGNDSSPEEIIRENMGSIQRTVENMTPDDLSATRQFVLARLARQAQGHTIQFQRLLNDPKLLEILRSTGCVQDQDIESCKDLLGNLEGQTAEFIDTGEAPEDMDEELRRSEDLLEGLSKKIQGSVVRRGLIPPAVESSNKSCPEMTS